MLPEWLLSVISEILAGRSPVSALSFVASFTLLYGPCVFLGCLCFASFSGHTHDDTQDVIVHLISQSW